MPWDGKWERKMIHVRKYNLAADKFAVVGTIVIFLQKAPVVEDIIGKIVQRKLFSFPFSW